MTWTSKSPSHQGLRTPLRVIAGRYARLELLPRNYLSLLLNRSTDRPTRFSEDGGDGGGGGGWKPTLGETFSCWGIKGSNFPLLLAFNTGCALILLAHALCVFGVWNFMTRPISINIIQESWTQLCCAMLNKVGKRIQYFWSHLRT